MACCRRCWESFIQLSVKLDDEVNCRTLMGIPVPVWRYFVAGVYAHLCLSMVLVIAGCVCFCLGIEYSSVYEEVNCSDGTNIAIPILNVIAAFLGLFALKTQNLRRPAVVHLIAISTILPLNLISCVDLGLACIRWFRATHNPHLSRLGVWAITFAYMDLGLALLALLNDVACLVLLYIYINYWCSRSHLQMN